MAGRYVVLEKGRRRPSKKSAKRSPRKRSAKRRPRRRRRPKRVDPFAKSHVIEHKSGSYKVARYGTGQASGAVATVIMEAEGKSLGGMARKVLKIAEAVREKKPYKTTTAYLRFIAWCLSKTYESDQQKIARELLKADMIPRGMTKLIVLWAKDAGKKRYERESVRSRVEGEWQDFLAPDHEHRQESLRRGRVQRAVMYALLDTSITGRWYEPNMTLCIQIASPKARREIESKVGSKLCGGASGFLAEPNDKSRYNNNNTQLTVTVPENWWERVQAHGLTIVDNRVVLDARQMKRKSSKGEVVYSVVYLDTGCYEDGGWRYNNNAQYRPKTKASQNRVRAWRGKIGVSPDGSTRFLKKRMEFKESIDACEDIEYYDDDDTYPDDDDDV